MDSIVRWAASWPTLYCRRTGLVSNPLKYIFRHDHTTLKYSRKDAELEVTPLTKLQLSTCAAKWDTWATWAVQCGITRIHGTASVYFLFTSCTPARCHRGHLPLARSRMHTATSHAIPRWNEPSATALSTIAACGRARNQPTDSGNQQSPASSHQPDTSPGSSLHHLLFGTAHLGNSPAAKPSTAQLLSHQ